MSMMGMMIEEMGGKGGGMAGMGGKSGGMGPYSKPPNYKKVMCKHYEQSGVCPYGNSCTFAHGPQDLGGKGGKSNYKTVMCKFYQQQGFCPRGDSCTFAHGAADLSRGKGGVCIPVPALS
mmetsp:Transcript_87009/g.106709  ORF Transcript_87009/g.106709 Transcript_87009/m.106709 type:complete len:120 (+) Transcript_87009:1-360(+)